MCTMCLQVHDSAEIQTDQIPVLRLTGAASEKYVKMYDGFYMNLSVWAFLKCTTSHLSQDQDTRSRGECLWYSDSDSVTLS